MSAQTSVAAGSARPARPANKRLVGLVVVVVTLMAAVMAGTLLDARAIERADATKKASNIVLSVQREVERNAAQLDLAMQSAASALETPGLAAFDPDVRQVILFGHALPTGRVGRIVISDEGGRVIFGSLSPASSPFETVDPEMFQSLRTWPEQGLLVGHPQQLTGGHEWRLLLARRINHADGTFAGVVMGVLPVSVLRTLFDLPVIGRHDIISLATLDGQIMTRRPLPRTDSAFDISKSPLYDNLRRAPVGTYEAVSAVDGVRRLYAYRKIGTLPVIISVGFSLSEVYGVWDRTTATIGTMVLLLVLLGLVLAVAVQREWRRRERAEDEHAEALARLDAVFKNSPDSLVVARVMPDGRFLYEAMNPGWERVSGATPADFIGRTPQQCLSPAAAGIVIDAWSQCVRERRTVEYALLSSHEGKAVEWDALVAPVLDKQGNVDRLVAVARDVTMRNLFQTSLQRAQRMEAVGQLTAGLAHDFNNLLQAILGTLEMIRKQPGLDAKGRKYVGLAENAADRGAKLVHRLLAYSRKQALTPVLLDPGRLLRELVPLLTSALGAGTRLETEIADGAWAIHADGPQLDDCLFNLAINARDAMPDGGVLRLRAANAGPEAAIAAGLPAGDYICFAVADQGHGMTPETMARALEPFFTTKKVGKGTGLGLSMVQGFVRQSGGDVRIESVVGQGTTVTLWLPRAATDAKFELVAVPAEPARKGDCRGRILVVDDEADVRETLSMILADAGFDPVAVASGEAALALLQAGEACDVMVTDQSMPGMTGSMLIGEVARLRPKLPTMLITGFDKVSGLDELQGRVTVLRKPFRSEPFLHQIQALLVTSTPRPTVLPMIRVAS